jgi:hypothetical protein
VSPGSELKSLPLIGGPEPPARTAVPQRLLRSRQLRLSSDDHGHTREVGLAYRRSTAALTRPSSAPRVPGVDSGKCMAWVLVLALVAALVTPAAAQAATISGDRGSFAFEAAQGETNRVEARAEGGALTFRDRGGGLIAGPGCENFSSQSVICARGGAPILRVDFNLRDGHDVLDAYRLLHPGSRTRATIDAGDGDDQVSHAGGTEDPEGTLWAQPGHSE